MRPNLSSLSRRAIGLAFATTLLASGIASAASPAGDGPLNVDFNFRDEGGKTAVLAVYPYSDTVSQIGYFRVKGPEVEAIPSYPQPHMAVKWRVIVQVADHKAGPYKIDSKSSWKQLSADKVGPLERFKNRSVAFQQRSEQVYVRLTVKIVWLAEDGGVYHWVKHTYEKYGLAESSGLLPSFGDEAATKTGQAPNRYSFR